jgi:hypothetical protein
MIIRLRDCSQRIFGLELRALALKVGEGPTPDQCQALLGTTTDSSSPIDLIPAIFFPNNNRSQIRLAYRSQILAAVSTNNAKYTAC